MSCSSSNSNSSCNVLNSNEILTIRKERKENNVRFYTRFKNDEKEYQVEIDTFNENDCKGLEKRMNNNCDENLYISNVIDEGPKVLLINGRLVYVEGGIVVHRFVSEREEMSDGGVEELEEEVGYELEGDEDNNRRGREKLFKI